MYLLNHSKPLLYLQHSFATAWCVLPKSIWHQRLNQAPFVSAALPNMPSFLPHSCQLISPVPTSSEQSHFSWILKRLIKPVRGETNASKNRRHVPFCLPPKLCQEYGHKTRPEAKIPSSSNAAFFRRAALWRSAALQGKQAVFLQTEMSAVKDACCNKLR